MLSAVILLLSDVLLFPANEYRTLRFLGMLQTDALWFFLDNKFDVVIFVIEVFILRDSLGSNMKNLGSYNNYSESSGIPLLPMNFLKDFITL
jgi:hypothetical protein